MNNCKHIPFQVSKQPTNEKKTPLKKRPRYKLRALTLHSGVNDSC